ncbi:MAG TPA: hypothetical protein P5514_15040 [Bacteroidales bacterium]|nr:hypothetical protein [Bacteroidales bacterium]
MKNNYLIKISMITFLMIIIGIKSQSQTATLSDVSANPGESVLVSLDLSGFSNIGAISFYIQIDPAVVTFTGITNVWSGASTTLANYIPSTQQIGISWLDFSGVGVNFPNGKYLDLQLDFVNGYSDLTFTANCEVSDASFNTVNVVYTNGSVGQPSVSFDLTVFLEGPYNTSTDMMSNDLNSNGYIPLSHPYNPALPYYDITNNADLNWYYTGAESVISIPADVVDWVVVELRDAGTAATATGATMIAQKACFLKTDGSIVDIDGTSLPQFFVSFTNKAFVVVWHRNHLGILSSGSVPHSGSLYTYDFSTSETKVFGGSNGHKELEPGVWGMITGDGNGNGLIQNTDETAVWKADLGSSGYKGGDFDMNGLTQNTDETAMWKPNLGGGGQVPAKSSGTGYVCQVPK